MATRTAKGTASSKSTGAALTISDMALSAGATLDIGLGYDDAQGHPISVRWGNRHLVQRVARNPGGFDIAASVWRLPRVKNTGVKDLTARWSSPIAERAMIATQLEGKNRIDERQGNNHNTETTGPTTGQTLGLNAADDFALCFFVSEGPSSDTAGAAEIMNGGSPGFDTATLGQRAGTTGAPPASNVTIQEAFLQLTSNDPTEGHLVGATSRKWISMMVTLTDAIDNLAVTFSARAAVEEILESSSPLIGNENVVFYFNDELDRWEAWDVTDFGTLVAVYGANTNWWEAV